MVKELEKGIVVTIGCKLLKPKRAKVKFSLIPSVPAFNTGVLSETDESIWGPVPLPKLLEGIPNECTYGIHRYDIILCVYVLYF